MIKNLYIVTIVDDNSFHPSCDYDEPPFITEIEELLQRFLDYQTELVILSNSTLLINTGATIGELAEHLKAESVDFFIAPFSETGHRMGENVRGDVAGYIKDCRY